MSGEDAWDLADRFVEALSQEDELAAANCCTDDGWGGATDSASRLYREVLAKGLKVEAGECDRDEERATAELIVTHDARAEDRRVVTLLLLYRHGRWLVDGLSLGNLHPTAFLSGLLEARPVAPPADPESIFKDISAEGRAGRRLANRLEQLAAGSGKYILKAARVLRAIDRAEVRLATEPVDSPPAEIWVYIDTSDGRVLSEDTHPSWASFLAERYGEPDDDDPVTAPPDFH